MTECFIALRKMIDRQAAREGTGFTSVRIGSGDVRSHVVLLIVSLMALAPSSLVPKWSICRLLAPVCLTLALILARIIAACGTTMLARTWIVVAVFLRRFTIRRAATQIMNVLSWNGCRNTKGMIGVADATKNFS